jgi:hypothetical protein
VLAIGLSLFAPATAAPAIAAAPVQGSWIGLDSGRVGDYHWSVKAKQRPCLLVGTSRKVGPYSYRKSKYRACAPSTTNLATSEPPLIATSVQPTSATAAEITAVGMIVAPAARRVRITLPNGNRATIPLERPSPAQASASMLGRFRYAAFAVRGWWCPERIVSQDASGRTLWDSGSDGYRCNAVGPPNFSE